MMNPIEVAEEWGGCLRTIEFPVPKPLLPTATTSFLYYAGVPKTFEVTTYQCIKFEFLPTATNLAAIWGKEMPDFSLPVGWAGMWRIGNITYTQAAAWLCIEELTGRVVAIDVEIDDSLYPVNGSLEGMLRCMKAVRDLARSARGSLARVGDLQDALPAEEEEYFWQPLIQDAIESGCDTLVVDYE